MVTTQLRVPEHAPDQPLNVEPELADAISVTTVPAANACVQVAEQERPAGLLLTWPAPVPAFTTVRALATPNRAVTVCGAVIQTLQVRRAPAHAPDQPANAYPGAAVAVNVT